MEYKLFTNINGSIIFGLIYIYELVSNWPHFTSTVVFIIKWFFQIRTWGCSGAHFTLIKSIILETSWCDQKQNSIIETCGTPFSSIQCFWASLVKSNKHKWHNNYLEEEENIGLFDEYVLYFQYWYIYQNLNNQIRRILYKDLLTYIYQYLCKGFLLVY